MYQQMMAQLALWKCAALVVPEHQVKQEVKTEEMNGHPSLKMEQLVR
jgi:hypothetical protein